MRRKGRWVVKDTNDRRKPYVNDAASWSRWRYVFTDLQTARDRAEGKRGFGYLGVRVFRLVPRRPR